VTAGAGDVRGARGQSAALIVVAAVGAACALTVGIVGSPSDGVLTGLLLGVVAVPVLYVSSWVARRRRRLGPLARQFAVTAAIAVGQLLVTAALFVLLMFVSAHDALLLGLVAVFCGALAIAALRPLARGVMSDVSAVGGALDAVADGRRDVRIPVDGHDELAELAHAANRMVERLAAEEHARRQLVAAVSHDLRTPITSLRLLAEGLGDDIIPPQERRAYLDRMGVHLVALSALIDDLFELTRLEAGELRWSMQRVPVHELVRETVDAMHEHATAKGVVVRSAVDPDLAPVKADPERLQRVLFNLIQNAIRHTPPDGSVTVLAEPVDGHLEIEVADTGAGIAAADRERVFDAFFRGGDAAARSDEGAGLGLAISRAIVEAHGGRIWLANVENGARIRFSLAAD
jgi:signal transduction histidine kinase